MSFSLRWKGFFEVVCLGCLWAASLLMFMFLSCCCLGEASSAGRCRLGGAGSSAGCWVQCWVVLGGAGSWIQVETFLGVSLINITWGQEFSGGLVS